MNKLSRRSLARWAADELADGKPAADIARHLAAAMKQNGLSEQVGFLVGDVMWELEQRKILAVGNVTSANALSRQLQSAISAQLKKSTGAEHVVIQNQIDKSVLGGLRVETAGRVWDQTVKRKLQELREVF